MAKENNLEGAFFDSLVRTNKDIKHERATRIGRSSKNAYRRYCEDIQEEIDTLLEKQEAILDMSPDNRYSLVLAKDFDAEAFATEDNGIMFKLRNLQIRLELGKTRYLYLFNEKIN